MSLKLRASPTRATTATPFAHKPLSISIYVIITENLVYLLDLNGAYLQSNRQSTIN
jgi:hypothetical protein